MYIFTPILTSQDAKIIHNALYELEYAIRTHTTPEAVAVRNRIQELEKLFLNHIELKGE